MKLLRCKEAAERLGLKPVAVRELDRRGLLPAVRDWAGHRRFREDQLDDFRDRLMRGEISPTAHVER